MLKSRLISYLFSKVELLFTYLSFFIGMFGFGQTLIEGTVTDSINQPISYTNVLLKPVNSEQILSYTVTGVDGKYSFNTKQKGEYNLTFTALGFTHITIPISLIDTTKLNISVVLKEKKLMLEQVVIETDLSIKVKKDTITFNVDNFRRGDEIVLEDLIKKLPGLQVDDDGKIKVGGREIERLMVDGDDLFEKGYNVLSKNMTADAVDKIEVYDKYSSNRLLKDIEDSDRVALNIKLKENYKQQWFGNADLGIGGFDKLYHKNRLNLMSFGKKSKFYLLANSNNIGIDAIGDITEMIRPRRQNQSGNIGDGNKASNIVNTNTSSPQLKKNRTDFNNARVFSLNAIHKINEKLKIRTLFFFNWDKNEFFRNTSSQIILNNENFINTEDFSMIKNKFLGFGKIDLTFDISKNEMLEYSASLSGDNLSTESSLIFNQNNSLENLNTENSLIDQKILYTHKISPQEVLLLSGRHIKNESPQSYTNNQFLFDDLFETTSTIERIAQNSNNNMNFFGTEIEYNNRKANKNLFTARASAKYRTDKLFNTFRLFDENDNFLFPQNYQNNTLYDVLDINAKTSYLYNFTKKISVTAQLEAHQLRNQFQQFNEIVQKQTFFYLQPQLNIRWDINDKNALLGNYSNSTNNASAIDLFNNFALTDFRSFNRGLGKPFQLNASNYMLLYRLGNFGDKYFTIATINYIINHDYITTNSIVQENYELNEKILFKNQKIFNANLTIDRYFKSISSNLKLKLNYNNTNFINFVNASDRRQIDNRNYNYGLELRSGFLSGFNYHIGSEFKTSAVTSIQANLDNRQTITDNFSFLDLSYVTSRHFNVNLRLERYYFGNLDNSQRIYYYSDFSAMYKTKNNKFVFRLSGRNLFNVRTFRNFYLTDVSTSITEYRLLPRLFLLNVDFKF